MVDVDEFAYLPENAEQAGVSGPLPPVERIEHGPVSALRWGAGAVKVVFLHGGGQNAHTWDTVILGLGLSALAIDLPGHGRSQWREDGDYGPVLNAEAVEPVIRELAPMPIWWWACHWRPDRHAAGGVRAGTRAQTRDGRRHPVGAGTG